MELLTSFPAIQTGLDLRAEQILVQLVCLLSLRVELRVFEELSAPLFPKELLSVFELPQNADYRQGLFGAARFPFEANYVEKKNFRTDSGRIFFLASDCIDPVSELV